MWGGPFELQQGKKVGDKQELASQNLGHCVVANTEPEYYPRYLPVQPCQILSWLGKSMPTLSNAFILDLCTPFSLSFTATYSQNNHYSPSPTLGFCIPDTSCLAYSCLGFLANVVFTLALEPVSGFSWVSQAPISCPVPPALP